MADTQQLLKDILRVLRSLDEKAKPVREILTLDEAADYLRISPHTLRDKVRMQVVPCFKVGGAIRFRRSRLDKWVNRGEVVVLNKKLSVG